MFYQLNYCFFSDLYELLQLGNITESQFQMLYNSTTYEASQEPSVNYILGNLNKLKLE